MTNKKQFGGELKKARQGRGWEQSELARRIDAGQQSISRWEAGKVSPPAVRVMQLAEVLGRDPLPWLKLLGHNTAISNDDKRLPPVIPRLTVLPLDALPWVTFEFFCRDLINELQKGAEVHRYGTQGDTQKGIDLFARRSDGSYAIYQCKRRQDFGAARVKAAVEAEVFSDDHNVTERFILLSRPASSGAREEMAKHKGWVLLDIEDVSAYLTNGTLSKEKALRLVDKYFPGYRKAFLGIEDPSPWWNEEEYFAPFNDKSRAFSHAWQFVGRKGEISKLQDFIEGEYQVMILEGRGGIGKTRLLRDLVGEVNAKNPEVTVRFVATATNVTPVHIEQLSDTPRPLIVVDDAHERSDISVLFAGILRVLPNAKLLIVTRPYGTSRIQAEMDRAGVPVTQDGVITLNNLGEADAQSLALEVLKAFDGPEDKAELIAKVTKDCPLATVVGSFLVAKHEIDPRLLSDVEEFRLELFRKFRDVLLGDAGLGDDPKLARSLLSLVAVLQPVNLKDEDFKKIVERLYKNPYDEIIRQLYALEDAGVLTRRGAKLRIAPDLLGDFLVSEACFDYRLKRPTGFADQVFAAADGQFGRNVLINISKLDWRISEQSSVQADLLNNIWDRIKADFLAAKIFKRVEMLKGLQEVSYYQSVKVMELIKLALDNPTSSIEKGERQFMRGMGLTRREINYSEVITEIPPLLRSIAFHVDHLPEAANMLWQFAKQDNRPTNQYPDHPLRVLHDLIEITPSKPLIFNELLVTQAISWLSEDNESQTSPFDVLDGILQTEGYVSSTKGFAFQLSPFQVNYDAVKGLREKVISAAFKELKNKSLPRAVRGSDSLEASLRYPTGILGRTIDDNERLRWQPEMVTTLERLAEVIADKNLDPIVAIQILRSIHWHLKFSQDPKTSTPAKQVAAAIPNTEKYRLTRAMMDSWGDLFEERRRASNYQYIEDSVHAWHVNAAGELVKNRSIKDIVKILKERLTAIASINKEGRNQPGRFLYTLAAEYPATARELFIHCMTEPESIVTNYASNFLSAMLNNDPDDALSAATKAIEAAPWLKPAVAYAYGWGSGKRDKFSEGEIKLMGKLASDDNDVVRHYIVRAISKLAEVDKPTALAILARIDFSGSEKLAEEIFIEFEGHGAFTIDDLLQDEKTLKQLLANLVDCPGLDESSVTEFLVSLSAQKPKEVVELLQKRVEKYEVRDREAELHYTPFPYTLEGRLPLRVRESKEFMQVARQVRDWATKDTKSWTRQFFGPRIFAAVVAQYDDTTISLLSEWIEFPTRDRIEAVARLLAHAPRSFIWEQVTLVEQLLEQALSFNQECYDSVASSLAHSVITGARSGVPGQPFPEDEEQRDRAAEIANELPIGSAARKFYGDLSKAAANTIKRHLEHDEELLDDNE